MNVKIEFQKHNHRLVYIDHKYLPDSTIGISFLGLGVGVIIGAVRVYKITNGDIDWKNPIKTVSSWKDINTKSR